MISNVSSGCCFLFLTDSCNLECEHCYVEAGPFNKVFMSFDILDSTLQLLQNIGVNDIRLTGGEPTIHPKFTGFIETAQSRNFRIRLITNGTRILKSERFDKLLNHIYLTWVSLYGLESQSHNRVSKGAALGLQQTLDGVAVRTRAGHKIGLSALLLPNEADQVAAFVTRVADAGIKFLRFIPAQPDGRFNSHNCVAWDRIPQLCAETSILLETHTRRQDFQHLSMNTPFGTSNPRLFGVKSCLLKKREMWAVSPIGDLYPCCFTYGQRNCRIGNVTEADIDSRLTDYSSASAATKCRGLTPAFWGEQTQRKVSCPISSSQFGSVDATGEA